MSTEKSKVGMIVSIGAILSVVAVLGISYVTAFNAGNKAEKQIVATWTDNKNVLSGYTKKLSEAAQVPALQRDDLKEVVVAALDARYGDGGSKAMFQFIKEQNPAIDSSVYTQLQRIIEAGRDEFTVSQTTLIDQKRGYETQLGSFWRGTWLDVAGYPKVDLARYKIVTDVRTEDSFKSGTEEAIKLR